MSPFTAYRLRFTLEALQPLTLPEPRGAALRGALLESLWRQQGESDLGSVAEPAGQQLRPYTIEPPLTPSGQYAAGQRLTFGLTLFAGARDLVPSLIGAVRQWQTGGIGARQPRHSGETRYHGHRGQVRLLHVTAENPFTAQRQVLCPSDRQPDLSPTLAITAVHVATAAQDWPLDERAVVQLTFLTPTRLIARGQLVRSPQPARGGGPALCSGCVSSAKRSALATRRDCPATTLRRYSRTPAAITIQGGRHRLGGSVESQPPPPAPPRQLAASWAGADWESTREAMRALLPMLLWGSIVHVGKDYRQGQRLV